MPDPVSGVSSAKPPHQVAAKARVINQYLKLYSNVKLTNNQFEKLTDTQRKQLAVWLAIQFDRYKGLVDSHGIEPLNLDKLQEALSQAGSNMAASDARAIHASRLYRYFGPIASKLGWNTAVAGTLQPMLQKAIDSAGKFAEGMGIELPGIPKKLSDVKGLSEDIGETFLKLMTDKKLRHEINLRTLNSNATAPTRASERSMIIAMANAWQTALEHAEIKPPTVKDVPLSTRSLMQIELDKLNGKKYKPDSEPDLTMEQLVASKLGIASLIVGDLENAEKIIGFQVPRMVINTFMTGGLTLLGTNIEDLMKLGLDQLHRTAIAQSFEALEKEHQAILDKIKSPDSANLEKTFVENVPKMLFVFQPDQLNPAFRRIESDYEHKKPPANYHPLEDVMMLLLRHPDGDDTYRGRITSALTAVYGYLFEHSIGSIPAPFVKSLMDVGYMTHNFRNWRYDTLSGFDDSDSSLFHQYGFIAINNGRKTDETYGKGFLLTKTSNPDIPMADDTVVEFRRGYLVISNDNGTLLIRNSSPNFGRNLFQHPAYYSPSRLSKGDLATFDPQKILTETKPTLDKPETASTPTPDGISEEKPLVVFENFRPIMDAHLYKQDGYIDKLHHLTTNLMEIKDHYRKWRLDTTDFEGGTFMGASRKDGFKSIVSQLNQWNAMLEKGALKSADGKPMQLPDLAFVHPDYPPYSSYQFETASGTPSRRFKMTPEHLAELTDYVEWLSGNEDAWNEEKYPDSDWTRFLQTGIDNQAELVLLAPEESLSDIPAKDKKKG